MKREVEGKIVQYSDCDESTFGRYNMYLSGGRYAMFWNGSKSLYVHRYIMKPSSGMVVDHINGDSLDNRRENLQVITQSENLIKMKDQSNLTGQRNIYFDKRGRKSPYKVEITRRRQKVYCKSFMTLEDAIMGRDKFLTYWQCYDIV